MRTSSYPSPRTRVENSSLCGYVQLFSFLFWKGSARSSGALPVDTCPNQRPLWTGSFGESLNSRQAETQYLFLLTSQFRTSRISTTQGAGIEIRTFRKE